VVSSHGSKRHAIEDIRDLNRGYQDYLLHSGARGRSKKPACELDLQVFAGGLFWSVAENPVNGASPYWPKLARTVMGDLAAKVESPTAVARAVWLRGCTAATPTAERDGSAWLCAVMMTAYGLATPDGAV